MAENVDVVIIGAGLSGLQAAIDVHEAGYSVLVLEARNRVGGKTFSVQRADGKGIVEVGAAWLNDTNQSHVWAYCKRFGLTPVVQNIQGAVASQDAEGNCHYFPFGQLPNFLKADVDSINTIRERFEAASLDPENFKQPTRGQLDQLTFEQWLLRNGATEAAVKTATVWCRGTLGQDPNEVSTLAFLEIARGAHGIINLRYDGKHGAQHLRLEEGTQSIAVGMAKLLPADSIMLNNPVSSVLNLNPNQYIITTSNGLSFKARKVIISIPSPAYKNITFDPPLPPQRLSYTSSVRYGFYVKYIAMFKSPFWRRESSCGLMQSFVGPVNHCRDTSVDTQGNYTLTCFVTSAPGRRWSQLNELDRREAVLKQLGLVFGVGYEAVKSEFLGEVVSEWMQDKWAGWGCPFAAPPPNTVGFGEDSEITESPSGGLYFVGTELTNEWRGYMEGALRSGKRGAGQVLADLRAGNSVL